MTPLTPIDILSRWLHVSTACIVIGSAFFMRILLPIAIGVLQPEQREAVFLKARRAFKMVVHSGILLFLLTGTYNAIRAWPKYNERPGLTHGLFGIHVLLALIIFTLSLIQLAGAKPKPAHRTVMAWVLVLLFTTVAAASALKWAREYAHDHPKVLRAVPATALTLRA